MQILLSILFSCFIVACNYSVFKSPHGNEPKDSELSNDSKQNGHNNVKDPNSADPSQGSSPVPGAPTPGSPNPGDSASGDPNDLPPAQQVIPLAPTFEEINKVVFQKTCIKCHNPTGSGKRVPLDREGLLNSPLELVIPGNADESGLIISLERADKKRMPPIKDRYYAIRPEIIAVIRQWIDQGAL